MAFAHIAILVARIHLKRIPQKDHDELKSNLGDDENALRFPHSSNLRKTITTSLRRILNLIKQSKQDHILQDLLGRICYRFHFL